MIPSPSFNSISIGPLTIHIYGLIIALAIISCYIITLKIKDQKHFTNNEIDNYFFYVLLAAFIGARGYHVFTNIDFYLKNPQLIVAIWNGGLGIMGGILTALLVIYIFSRKGKKTFFQVTDLLAVVLPLGHAIGRWGNYFNQELFGMPTSFAWALYIDQQHRPFTYREYNTFHPTFLYESALNIINFLILLTLYRRNTLKDGMITALYMINYGFIRFLIEVVKIDPDSSAFIGLFRVPQYLSLFFILTGITILIKQKNQFTR